MKIIAALKRTTAKQGRSVSLAAELDKFPTAIFLTRVVAGLVVYIRWYCSRMTKCAHDREIDPGPDRRALLARPKPYAFDGCGNHLLFNPIIA